MHVEKETTVDSELENKQSRNMPSVVTASILPYQYLTSKGILKFNRVQVKPQQCTWEQSCAAHSCCCVALRRKLQKNWLGPDPRGTAGKAKGPFRGTFYWQRHLLQLWLDALFTQLSFHSSPLLFLLLSWCRWVPFPALPKCRSKDFLLLSLPCSSYTC